MTQNRNDWNKFINIGSNKTELITFFYFSKQKNRTKLNPTRGGPFAG